MKNKKENKVKEFLGTPQGKPALFFGFYFIFFLVLIILVRTNSSSNNSVINTDSSVDLPFSLTKIENGNYHFSYSFNIDSNVYLYEGDKSDYKELFSFNNIKYYRSDSIFLSNVDNKWIKVDNPYILSDFIDINNISSILKNSTYVSKTDYDSGMVVYDYRVSTPTLVKILNNDYIDLDDAVNEIIVKVDENNDVSTIIFNFSSYGLYSKIAFDQLDIELNYSNYGNVNDISDPE